MEKRKLRQKIARLETLCDHLLCEFSYIDQLMRSVGFANGLETVKITAKELYDLERRDFYED